MVNIIYNFGFIVVAFCLYKVVKYIRLRKSKCIENNLKYKIAPKDIAQYNIYCYTESWGDDDYTVIALNGDERVLLQIKECISAITPEEYLELDDTEAVNDFLWMLHVYYKERDDEIDGTIDINKDNIREMSTKFVQNITRNPSCEPCDVHSHIYFLRSCDVNCYGVLWKTTHEERIYYDAFCS